MNKKIFYFIFTIINMIYFYIRQNNISSKKFIIIFCGLLFLHIGLYFLLNYMANKKLKNENIYLILSIIFGTLMLIFLPPTEIPDTKEDYLRTLEVSKFHATSIKKDKEVGRNFSTNIDVVFEGYQNNSYSKVLDVKNLKLNKKEKFYNFPTKSLYSFVCYIPQAIGVFIGRILNLSIYTQTILGRITNYMIFVLLIYLSIKIIPYKKELIMFLSLLPITIQQSVSLNPDALTLSSSIFLISYICYLRNNDKKITRKDMIILSITSIVISLCKIVYLPFCALIFLLPKSKFENNKKKILFCLIVCIISAMVNLVWLKISSDYLIAFSNRSNSSLQLNYILHNPITYIYTIFNTIDTYLVGWILQMIGISLGVYTVQSVSIYVVISLIILIKIIFKRNTKKYIFNKFERIFIFLILICIIVLIFTSLYMQWTKPYNLVVEGIQGRYFIPLILLFTLAISDINEKYEGSNLIGYYIINNLACIITIIACFV